MHKDLQEALAAAVAVAASVLAAVASSGNAAVSAEAGRSHLDRPAGPGVKTGVVKGWKPHP